MWIILLIACAVIIYLGSKLSKYRKNIGTLAELTDKVGQEEVIFNQIYEMKVAMERDCEEAKSRAEQAKVASEELQNQLTVVRNELTLANEKRKSAVELAEQGIELEIEKRRHQYEEALDKEFELLKQNHSLTAYNRLLEQLNAKIEEARTTLRVQQEQLQKAAEKEDFDNVHSLGLNAADVSDVAMLREFSLKFGRKEVIYKLIWSEFYQRPLQGLRKSLNADKKTGIYMIRNKSNGKAYIGQALDIGDRWTQHVKTGLGIGSTSYMTNKFYMALNKGPEGFTYEVLEECPKEKLNERERYWIDFYNSISYGYNTSIGG